MHRILHPSIRPFLVTGLAILCVFVMGGVPAARAQGASGETTLAPVTTPQSTTSAPTTPPALPVAATGRTFDRPVALSARAQARITNLAANMSTRIDATISRYEHITQRLEARIAIMQGEGVDTEAATESLTSAKTSLVNLKANMSTIDSAVHTAVTAADGRSAWETVRAQYLLSNDAIRSIHTLLQETVRQLREADSPATASSSAAQ